MRKSTNYSLSVTGRRRFFAHSLSIIFGICVGVLLLNAILFLFPASRIAHYIGSLPVQLTWQKPENGSFTVSAIEGESSLSSAATENVQDETVDSSALPENVAQPNTLPGNLELLLNAIFEVLPTESPNREVTATAEMVNLGRLLFFDPGLSSNGTVSCNTCHNLQAYGVDGLPRSLGVTQVFTSRNAPSVYNAVVHKAQFWDGRSPTLEDQAVVPILAEHEMGMLDEATIQARLNANPVYPSLFKLAFPGDPTPMSLKNIGAAIGSFERGLLTPSRFDRFLAGDYSLLSEQELRGLDTFISLRCMTCHNGVGIGGGNYTRLGVAEAYNTQDVGRFAVTNLEEDRAVFKIASLRNVAETAPYLHDGSISTLEEMVSLMARYQLGKSVTTEEVADVVAFLHTLTGEIPADYVAEPELP